MVEAVTLSEVGKFLNILLRGYDDYIYFAFVMMIVFSIATFFKYIVTGIK